MQTHYLGEEEVSAYLVDLAERLRGMKDFPTLWVPIGLSGRELLKVLVKVAPDFDARFTPIPAEYDRVSRKVVFENDAAAQIAGRHVLVLDSSVHSGFTMRNVCQDVCSMGAKGVCSYTLVLKQASRFVPSFWGVSIGDFDRAYFLLANLPNNHFLDTSADHGQVRERPMTTDSKYSPYFHICKLGKADIQQKPVTSGLDSLDRTTWADRYYDMMAHTERRTYVLEAGPEACGYVTFDFRDGALSIEALAVDKAQQKKGYAASLVRWAETFARQSCCREVSLWSIENQITFYEKCGYAEVPGAKILDLGDEKYHLMSKKVLYHL